MKPEDTMKPVTGDPGSRGGRLSLFNRIPRLALAAAVALAGAIGLTASAGPVCPAAAAPPNPMHPLFQVLDEDGRPSRQSGRPVSEDRTCGSCHDVAYIHAHDSHTGPEVRAGCVACHFEGGELPREASAYDAEGRIRREDLRISAPRDENCAGCHGIVHSGSDPLLIPAGFEQGEASPGVTYALTRNTGEILSGQNLSDSYLNLQDKAKLDFPWDVHSRRLVGCVDCHFAANDPVRADVKHTDLDFLKQDPRRIPLAEFLRHPDHRLAAASCRSCHDPETIHSFLPYRGRHLEVLECQACHIPRMMGPAAQTIDASVVTEAGGPATTYRGVHRPEGSTLNAAFLTGYEPLLLPAESAEGKKRFAPYNAVDRWFWSSEGEPVPAGIVREAFLRDGNYAPEIVRAFDANGDGRIQGDELRLDSAEKTELIRGRLLDLGVREPAVRRKVELHKIEHGVMGGKEVRRDCRNCHSENSRLAASLELSSSTPFGADTTVVLPAGLTWSGPAVSAEEPGIAGLYLFGLSRTGWSDRIGFALFALVLAGVLLHALLRAAQLRRREASESPPTRRVYLFTRYERIWHWLMALSILVLMFTGFQVHFAGKSLMPLPQAVALHNVFAVILLANAFLSLFYHVTTSAIRQFLPGRKGLLGGLASQAHFYTRGLFLGQPHPTPKSEERKLNPLQQLTYLALLNVLFPFQAATGALIWGASRWPALAASVGGLSVVAPLHNQGSWLFLSFFILHLYLTTTGHTLFSNIRAMIDGYDSLDAAHAAPMGGSHAR